MLKIEHLKKSYENFSLDCSLEVKKGHVTGLIGQNGAGKSTTFKAILGLISFDSGTINILGKSLQDFTAKDKQDLGVVLSDSGFSGYLTINDIIPIIDKLEEAGCELQIEDRQIQIKAPKKLKSVNIKTMPYPGFPTDMQSIFATLLTTAKGSSIIVENIFENRYKYTQELIRMGAKISVEGKTAIIKGVKKLYGANVKATDLRGGAALVMAATTAKGITKVENIDYILRGYERFDKKLEKLGVKIQLKI